MLAVVAIWALAEAALWFIVADVPIMAVALRHGWRRGLTAACLAAVCAALGGLATMHWATVDPAGSRAAIEAVPGISPTLFDAAAAAYREGGWQAMLAGSFAGVPYKLYAHAAGIAGSGAAGFALASVVSRLPRFALVALVSGAIGPWLRRRIGERAMWALFAACWTGFYAWYFATVA
jgi:membrane protein YqaA with SNARE-associated domain